MFKPCLLLAGAALLLGGTAQAATPEAQTDHKPTTVAHRDAPAPKAIDDTTLAPTTPPSREADQELHPDARPVYLNGGYFGD